MSRHKFASNVCEKALLTADAESRRALIQEMMTSKQDGVSPIATMMKDQYASESYLAIPLPLVHSCLVKIMYYNELSLLQILNRSAN
jgi:hypothetical protein